MSDIDEGVLTIEPSPAPTNITSPDTPVVPDDDPIRDVFSCREIIDNKILDNIANDANQWERYIYIYIYIYILFFCDDGSVIKHMAWLITNLAHQINPMT